MAIFSELASPCMSTMMTAASLRSASTSRRPTVKGSSMAPFMNTRPLRLRVATGTRESFPRPTWRPRPGWPSG